ncbi:hypothetical protein [Brevibacillus borstelensis]|uniref:hypothetical protein n=1 Tax=Brevibacillus borstelensis TaxID=45462 RepID=UPI0030BD7403
MKKWSILAMSATLSLSLVSSGVLANETLGTGEDYYFTNHNSRVMDVTDTSAYLWAFTEGGGRDLSYVRVYSYFYVNGIMVKADYTNDPTYASIDYDASATRLLKAKITSSHYIYNKLGEEKKKVSEDQYPR